MPLGALADLSDVEVFDRSGEQDQLYAFQLSESLKFEELGDVDISHAVPRRIRRPAFTGSK